MTERNIKARFEVEATGDESAFRDAASDAQALKNEVANTLPTLEELQAQMAEMGKVLDEALGESHAELRDDLEKARRAVKDFQSDVEKGADGIESSAVRARRAQDQLLEKIRQIKRAGRDLTASQVKQLDELEKAYKDAVKAAGQLRKTQADVRKELKESEKAAGGFAGGISSLEDVFSALGERQAAFALKGGAVVGVLKAGYDAGKQFREGLAAIDKELNTKLLESLDRFVQKGLGVQSLVQRLFPAESASGQADELRNILNILRKNGIEPVSNKLGELRKQLADFARQRSEEAGGLKLTAKGFEDWAQSIGLSEINLGKLGRQLVKFVGILQENNKAIDETRLGEALKPQIQSLLDGFLTLGVEVPPAIQKIADSLGILDTKSEEAFEKQKKLVKEYREELNTALGKLPSDIQERAAAIKQVIDEDLTFQNVSILPIETKDKLAEQMRGLIQVLQQSGQPIDDRTKAIAGALGIIVPSFTPIQKGAKETGKALSEIGKGGSDADRNLDETARKLGELGGKAATAGGEIKTGGKEIGSGLGEVAKEVDTFVGKVEAALEKLKTAASGLSGFLAPVRSELATTRAEVADLQAAINKLDNEAPT